VTWKNTGKLKFYREMDFHPSVWSWNNMPLFLIFGSPSSYILVTGLGL